MKQHPQQQGYQNQLSQIKKNLNQTIDQQTDENVKQIVSLKGQALFKTLAGKQNNNIFKRLQDIQLNQHIYSAEECHMKKSEQESSQQHQKMNFGYEKIQKVKSFLADQFENFSIHDIAKNKKALIQMKLKQRFLEKNKVFVPSLYFSQQSDDAGDMEQFFQECGSSNNKEQQQQQQNAEAPLPMKRDAIEEEEEDVGKDVEEYELLQQKPNNSYPQKNTANIKQINEDNKQQQEQQFLLKENEEQLKTDESFSKQEVSTQQQSHQQSHGLIQETVGSVNKFIREDTRDGYNYTIGEGKYHHKSKYVGDKFLNLKTYQDTNYTSSQPAYTLEAIHIPTLENTTEENLLYQIQSQRSQQQQQSLQQLANEQQRQKQQRYHHIQQEIYQHSTNSSVDFQKSHALTTQSLQFNPHFNSTNNKNAENQSNKFNNQKSKKIIHSHSQSHNFEHYKQQMSLNNENTQNSEFFLQLKSNTFQTEGTLNSKRSYQQKSEKPQSYQSQLYLHHYTTQTTHNTLTNTTNATPKMKRNMTPPPCSNAYTSSQSSVYSHGGAKNLNQKINSLKKLNQNYAGNYQNISNNNTVDLQTMESTQEQQHQQFKNLPPQCKLEIQQMESKNLETQNSFLFDTTSKKPDQQTSISSSPISSFNNEDNSRPKIQKQIAQSYQNNSVYKHLEQQNQSEHAQYQQQKLMYLHNNQTRDNSAVKINYHSEKPVLSQQQQKQLSCKKISKKENKENNEPQLSHQEYPMKQHQQSHQTFKKQQQHQMQSKSPNPLARQGHHKHQKSLCQLKLEQTATYQIRKNSASTKPQQQLSKKTTISSFNIANNNNNNNNNLNSGQQQMYQAQPENSNKKGLPVTTISLNVHKRNKSCSAFPQNSTESLGSLISSQKQKQFYPPASFHHANSKSITDSKVLQPSLAFFGQENFNGISIQPNSPSTTPLKQISDINNQRYENTSLSKYSNNNKSQTKVNSINNNNNGLVQSNSKANYMIEKQKQHYNNYGNSANNNNIASVVNFNLTNAKKTILQNKLLNSISQNTNNYNCKSQNWLKSSVSYQASQTQNTHQSSQQQCSSKENAVKKGYGAMIDNRYAGILNEMNLLSKKYSVNE